MFSTKAHDLDYSPLVLQVLTPERMPDFLRFFDEDAFSDNPKWASCYCQCFYEDHRVVSWKDRTREENRRFACDRGANRAMRGHLAYLDGVVVGWCNAVPRTLLHALDEEGPIPDADVVGSIACFIVDPAARGRGIARALLEAACEGFRRDGLRIAEGYPRAPSDDPAANHFGPLGLFLASGFSIVRTDDDGSLTVRKTL
jgi:ribosomal protein S18 acetylase RimI-like enzyme